MPFTLLNPISEDGITRLTTTSESRSSFYICIAYASACKSLSTVMRNANQKETYKLQIDTHCKDCMNLPSSHQSLTL